MLRVDGTGITAEISIVGTRHGGAVHTTTDMGQALHDDWRDNRQAHEYNAGMQAVSKIISLTWPVIREDDAPPQ